MRLAIFILWMLLPATAFGQIAASRVYTPYEPIVIHIQDQAGEGQQVNALWTIDQPAKSVKVSPTTVHIWAPPRERPYAVRAMVWVTQRVQIPQPDGTTVEGDLLIGPPRDHSSEFIVSGAEPDKPDEPDRLEPDRPEPDKPEPDKPDPDLDDPDLPDDEFNNVARRAYEWGKDLKQRPQVANIHRETAKLLLEDPSQTNNTAAQWMTDELNALTQTAELTEFRRLVREDTSKLWKERDMRVSKQDFAKYLNLVADGVEAGG